MSKYQIRNQEVRTMIAESGVHYWEVAEQMGMRADKFSVLLRYPLEEKQKQTIFEAIRRIKEETHGV